VHLWNVMGSTVGAIGGGLGKTQPPEGLSGDGHISTADSPRVVVGVGPPCRGTLQHLCTLLAQHLDLVPDGFCLRSPNGAAAVFEPATGRAVRDRGSRGATRRLEFVRG
jgi:hypothetical protein